MQVDEFLNEHFTKNHYQCYCEAVIARDGGIEYAIPSHVYYLEALYLNCNPMQLQFDLKLQVQLCNEMPIEASPVHWLVDKLGVISVWYNTLLCPCNITEEQIQTIHKLIQEKAICFQPNIIVTVEAQCLKIRKERKSDIESKLYSVIKNREQVEANLIAKLNGRR